MNLELPWETSSTSRPKKKKKIRESTLWQHIKKAIVLHKPTWTHTRIETWAMPGVPDVMVCDDKGLFHLIELKIVTGYAVKLSPHQVSFAQNHAHASVWLLVWKADEYYLYPAKEVIEVADKGLRHIPLLKTQDLNKLLSLLSTH